MPFTKLQKLKLGIIKNWPLNNKLRMARKLLPDTRKGGIPLFKGISFLNSDSLLFTETSNYLEYSVFTTGTYEEQVVKLLKSQIRNGAVVFDIGANIGIHSITMARCAGTKGKVFAFEPIHFLAEKLKRNLWINNLDNVVIVPFALSDIAGKDKVYFNENESNLGTVSLANDAFEKNYELEIRRGDDLVAEFGIDRLDFMKIDVEGLELNVLIGLENSIIKYRPRIVFEYDVNYIQRVREEGQDVIRRLYDFFSDKNYELYVIDANGMNQITGRSTFPISENIFAIPQPM